MTSALAANGYLPLAHAPHKLPERSASRNIVKGDRTFDEVFGRHRRRIPGMARSARWACGRKEADDLSAANQVPGTEPSQDGRHMLSFSEFLRET